MPISLPSLSFTVTFPSLPTSTVAPSGNVGFAFLTASSTAFFSSGVKLDGSFTSTGFSGAFIAALTALSAGIVPITFPSLSFTVTFPSLPTSTVASFGKSGFAFLTASSTAFFSSGVKLDGSFTSTGFSGAFISGVVVLSPAFAVAESDGLPALSFAFAVTSVPSATLSAGIVTFPVVGSTVTPSGASFGSVQFPSSPFIAVTVTGSVFPSGV